MATTSRKHYQRAAAIVRMVRRRWGDERALQTREAFKLLFWNEPRFDKGRFDAACEGTYLDHETGWGSEPEIIIYNAQAREDAAAKAEKRKPRVIATVEEARRVP